MGGSPVLDLDYREDSSAGTDMNLVMTSAGQFVEIQGTAEHGAFTDAELASLLALGKSGLRTLFLMQVEA